MEEGAEPSTKGEERQPNNYTTQQLFDEETRAINVKKSVFVKEYKDKVSNCWKRRTERILILMLQPYGYYRIRLKISQ